MLGLAIDGLISQQINPVYWLVAMLFIGTILGTSRRIYDTRCYGKIYKELALANAVEGWNQGLNTSALSARTEQVQEMVQFIESDLVECFNATLKVIGAIVMLAILDLTLLFAVSLTAVLIFIIYSFSGPRIYRLNRGLNDQLDYQVAKLNSKNPAHFSAHLSSIVRWFIRLSDLEARNFFLMDVIVIALVGFSLWQSASTGTQTAGGIFILLSYILEFIEGIYLLPITYQQLVRLREISSRLSLPPTNKISATN